MKQNILLKTFVLLIAMLAGGISASAQGSVSWPDEKYLVIGPSNGTSSESGLVFTKSSKYTIQSFSSSGTSKFNGQSFTYGLKHESGTSTAFTTTAVSTITIVQSTIVNGDTQMKLGSTELSAWEDATKTTYSGEDNTTTNQNIHVYTIPNVPAGTYSIERVSGQPYMLYVGITYTGAQVAVVDPVISLTESTLSINCETAEAAIYYTTDGTEPTEESIEYSEPVTLDNACTVRAIAVKGTDKSNIISKECFIPYSDAFAVLQFSDANPDGKTWARNGFVLTATSTDIAEAMGLGTGVSAFKLTANETYTLQTPEDFKVTKIVVVGKTWLAGTSTFAIADFDGTGAFYTTVKEADNSYTRYIGSYTFTPQTESYGATITMTPGGTQLGAYFVVYGEERKGPAEPTSGVTVTEVATIKSDGKAETTVTPSTYSSVITTSGSKSDNPLTGYSYGLKLESSSGKITIKLPSEATNATLVLLDKAGVTNIKFTEGETTTTMSNEWKEATVGKEATFDVSAYAGKTLEITKGNGSPVICKITLTYSVGSANDIYLTTTANMAGWRSFYDADQAYTVDENTTVYAVTEVEGTAITLTDFEGGIPAGTPVVLKTDAEAETDGTFKMTLTKAESVTATVPAGNMLQASSAAQALSGVYRLGFGDTGVGFYAYSTSSAAAGIVYLETESGAPMLSLGFGDEGTTGIDVINANVKVAPRKVLKDGRIVIETSEGTFLMNGARVK